MNPAGDKPLRDILKPNLKLLFIGYNPSLRSAELGHHYTGRSNRFWLLLYRSGLTDIKLSYTQDMELLNYDYGAVNIIDRPTKSAEELKREEYLEGRTRLKMLLSEYTPQYACYVGIGIYKAFSGKRKVEWGRQETEVVPGVIDFVAPSGSGLNRMSLEKQIEIYSSLKQLVVGPD